MDTKLVIRLLDIGGELLGWAQVLGHARGDGIIWIEDATQVPVDVKGTLAFVSVHWCDVNVELRHPVESIEISPENYYAIPGGIPAIVCGPAAGGLPSVTVRTPINLGVPVGSMGGITGTLVLSSH